MSERSSPDGGDPIRIGLNGFGRIGRATLRAARSDPRVEIVGINDVMDAEQMRYLFAHDSVYGGVEDVSLGDGDLVVDGRAIPVSAERDPPALPWDDLGVDVALECTGVFRSHDGAAGHLKAGADRALISAPPTGDREVLQLVYGVNEDAYDGQAVVSNASCTTNSVAPVVQVLDEAFGLEAGLLTTVHAYTGSQNLIDGPAAKFRRGRAAAENIVPTTTGAAQATTEVLPHLSGRLDGMAIRVPVVNGSVTELVATVAAEPTVEEINAAFRDAADGELAGVLGYTDDELVSRDVLGLPVSSLVDTPSTNVAGEGLVKVLAWYDNEYGFANRLLDVAELIAP